MPKPAKKGVSCPRCGSRKRTVRFTKLPCPGVRIRYCVCRECATHYPTRETVIMSGADRSKRK